MISPITLKNHVCLVDFDNPAVIKRNKIVVQLKTKSANEKLRNRLIKLNSNTIAKLNSKWYRFDKNEKLNALPQ